MFMDYQGLRTRVALAGFGEGVHDSGWKVWIRARDRQEGSCFKVRVKSVGLNIYLAQGFRFKVFILEL